VSLETSFRRAKMIRFCFLKFYISRKKKNFFSLDNFDFYTTEFPKGHIFICFTQGILCRTAPTVNGLILNIRSFS
jgi:hypothetical protein